MATNKVTATPDTLQQAFGIPADTGRAAVPRILFRYAGRNKAHFLATAISMTVAGALPEHGRRRRAQRRVAQQELAAMNGLSRTTITRRVSRFAVEKDRRARRDPVAQLIHRERGFAAPNLYSLRLPQQRDPKDPTRYIPPSLEQIRATPELAKIWDTLGDKWDAGYKDIPGWVWDKRLPLTDTARLVLTYYICCGLLQPDAHTGQVRGVVNPRQRTVAKACGIGVSSVYEANRELAGKGAPKFGVRCDGQVVYWDRRQDLCERYARRLSAQGIACDVGQLPPIVLIRVAQSKCERSADGAYKRGPAKIVYLPVRQLTVEEAEAERRRMRVAVLRHTGGHPPGGMLARAQQVHQDVLEAYQGTEHALRVFWRAARAKMLEAGIHRNLIDELVPDSPD